MSYEKISLLAIQTQHSSRLAAAYKPSVYPAWQPPTTPAFIPLGARQIPSLIRNESLPPLAGDGAPMKKMLAFFSWVPGKVAEGRKGGIQTQHSSRLAAFLSCTKIPIPANNLAVLARLAILSVPSSARCFANLISGTGIRPVWPRHHHRPLHPGGGHSGGNTEFLPDEPRQHPLLRGSGVFYSCNAAYPRPEVITACSRNTRHLPSLPIRSIKVNTISCSPAP